MTREEKIQRLINSQQLYTFEEWYEMNKYAFEMLKNSLNPTKLYEKYVAEVLGE